MTSYPRLSFVALAAAVLAAPCLYGGDVTWIGTAGDLQWSNALNWSTGALPGTNDRVVFRGTYPASGYASNAVIHLGASRTISEFRLVTNAPPFVLTGDGAYSLTLTNGSFSGDSGNNTPQAQAYVLDCDVIVGANAVWQGFGQYGSYQAVNGTLSDGGHGYPLTFNGNQNANLLFNGPVALSSTVTLNSSSCHLGGRLGAMTNVDFCLMPASAMNNGTDPFLIFDNSVYTNGDRFGDSHVIHNYSSGTLQMVGNGTNPVSETVGGVVLDSGILTLQNSFAGTNVELIVKSLTRPPGTALPVYYANTAGTGTPGVNTKIRIQGESLNTNGIWHPWAIQRGVDSYMRVDANGCLIPLATTDYLNLPISGSRSTGVYHTAAANLALSASEEAFGLRMDCTSNQVLDLGTNDLTIGCGALLFANAGAKTINSSGGKLVFRTNEIFIAGQLGASASNIFIHAPIASTATGNVYLCLPDLIYVNSLTLDGADYVGTYAGLTASLRTYQAILKLGGPSDRTINGPLCGMFSFVQTGTGALRLNGADLRFTGTIEVQTGRVVIGNSQALSSTATIRSGARLDVASNIVWAGGFTVESGSTLGGDGMFSKASPTLPTGLHFSPGNTVGKLTTSNITFQSGTVIDWDLGAGTNVAGVDYDLLHVSGTLTLTNAAMQVTVRDASAGRTTVRANTQFTVVDWTGGNPASTPSWTVSNASPATLDTSAATVQINNGTKKIMLSGLRSVGPRSTLILFR